MKIRLLILALVFGFCSSGFAGYTMGHPNTKIYRMQSTGTGNKDPYVTVAYRLKRKDNGMIISTGYYSDEFTGWMVSLNYSSIGLDIGVDADLLESGTVQVHKDVTTALYED